jgi:hypothetical protein
MADLKPFPPTPAGPLDLDQLLTRAMARQTPQKPRRKATDQITPEEMAAAERRVLARWRDPANWERVRNVILIHRDAQQEETLLGNFVEYKHKLSIGVCRKLVRDTQPAPLGEIEYVTGDNWLAERVVLGENQRRPEAVEAEETREAIVDLHLPELDHVFSPAVMVEVKLIWGGIAKVELMDETRFYSKTKQVQLILPAGMDVLEGMSLDCKLKLREWLGL